jgi:cytochrome b subunit of formate dehydrogenase
VNTNNDRSAPLATGGRWPYDRAVQSFLYWTAVIVISVAFVIGLVLFFESRDQSSLDSGSITSVAQVLF